MAADTNKEAESAPIDKPERKVTNEDNFVLEEEERMAILQFYQT